MYGINEIKKQNCQTNADIENSRNGTFCVLHNNEVLIRFGPRSKVLPVKDGEAFLKEVSGKSTGVIREKVASYFS